MRPRPNDSSELFELMLAVRGYRTGFQRQLIAASSPKLRVLENLENDEAQRLSGIATSVRRQPQAASLAKRLSPRELVDHRRPRTKRSEESGAADRASTRSRPKVEHVLMMLRSDNMLDLAEFLCALRLQNMMDIMEFRAFIDRHNQYLERLVEDPDRMAEYRRTRQNIEDCVFRENTKTRSALEATWERTPGEIEQTNLGRFLITSMSLETSRQLCAVCETCGFMTGYQPGPSSGYARAGSRVVRSTGIMEDIYESCTRELWQTCATLLR